MADVNTAFRLLRPLCVLVSQNHDVEAISNLEQLLSQDALSNDVLQEMHEYVAFPLRLVLKQYGISDEAVCVKSLQCLTTLLRKISLRKTSIFIDLFSNILNFISTPDRKTVFSEEVRHAAVEAMNSLFIDCDVSCYSSTLKEALPLFGGLVAGVLDIAGKERMTELRLASLNLMLTLIDSRNDKELKRLLEMVIPSYLPGISLCLTRILTSHGEKAKILVTALKLMQKTLVLSLADSANSDTTELVSSYFSGDSKFVVNKTEQWYKQASTNISAVIKKIVDSCITHSNWSVRLELVRWSHVILVNCNKHLTDCHNVLLDVITHNVSDGYPKVAECSQSSLRDVRAKVEGVAQVLEQRLYDIATTLPRKVSRYDEAGSLSVMKIFNGYLSSLESDVAALLRCHTHLQRISLALCQLLQLDCTVVNILESSSSDSRHLTTTEETFPVLRRQFTSFVDNAVWKEIQMSIHTIVSYGEVYVLVDYFVSEFQSNTHHRLQCAIILNEILTFYVKCPTAEDCSKEVLDCCTAVLELYSDGYRQLLASSSTTSSSASITQRNESTQLQCLILEGFVVIHQITGGSYPELLLNSLYSILESCAHDNILIKQTAVRGLEIISRAFHYRGSGELIEKHCNYLCNALSLNIRCLHRHPTSPAVLSSVLLYSQSTILPFIEQIIIEVLLCLDEHYTEDALSLLRVPQTLMKQLCVWFPRQPSSDTEGSATPPAVCNGVDSDSQARDVYNYVADYYKTRLAADNIDFSLEEKSVGEEVVEEDVQMEEMFNEEKKELPLFVILTKKVMERCRNLVSHSNAKIRLVTIDVIRDSCTALSHSQDNLLPAVHEIWAGFSRRFHDTEPLVIIQAINCLGVLGDLSKDFVRVRVGKEVLPNLTSLLHKKSSVSIGTGKAYRHTLGFKLQTVVLETVGKLCVDLKLSFEMMQKVILACLPYLSAKQPIKLQQVALCSLQQLANEDADLVWYSANNFSVQGCPSTSPEFTRNLSSLIAWIEHT